MDESRYYVRRYVGYPPYDSDVLWKVNKKVSLAANEDGVRLPGMAACVPIGVELNDEIPFSTENIKYKRITREAFKKCWNENYESMQKLRLHGGEYFCERTPSGDEICFHAFLRKPSRHYSISYRQSPEYADIDLSTENEIKKRRGIAKHYPAIPESVFCQAFKLVLDFFYDGSAMPDRQGMLWDALDSLGVSTEPDKPAIISENYHYERARELMLKRKDEIKNRLLELDDTPSKRRELRAEMKGIDYCVSILDKNH